MNSFKIVRTLLVAFLLVALVSAAQAATYGYIVVRGKNIDLINREIDTIERLIKTWHNGEVLYKHTIVSGGAFFFKKVAATVFFAGNQKDISAFITQGPYEGDYLKDITVSFNYRSMASKSNFDGDINTTFTKKYPNIRKAIETIQNKTNKTLWEELQASKSSAYKKHLISNELINPTATLVFYSVQAIEDNRLFGITFTAADTIPQK